MGILKKLFDSIFLKTTFYFSFKHKTSENVLKFSNMVLLPPIWGPSGPKFEIVLQSLGIFL